MKPTMMMLATLFLFACGGDAVTPDAATPDAVAAQPGTLTVVTQSLTGLIGKVAVIGALQGQTRIAGTCLQVATDPETLMGALRDFNMPNGNPCDLAATATTLPGGSYSISAGIFTPGQMVPEQCATATADVDGDTTVTLPAFGTCP